MAITVVTEVGVLTYLKIIVLEKNGWEWPISHITAM